jgi:hypothetical protein
VGEEFACRGTNGENFHSLIIEHASLPVSGQEMDAASQ